MPLYISPPPSNPLFRALMAIIGLLVMVGAFMFGLAALLVLLAVGLVAGIVFWVRLAWIRRQLRREGIEMPGFEKQTRHEDAQVIEAEYVVVERHSEGRD